MRLHYSTTTSPPGNYSSMNNINTAKTALSCRQQLLERAYNRVTTTYQATGATLSMTTISGQTYLQPHDFTQRRSKPLNTEPGTLPPNIGPPSGSVPSAVAPSCLYTTTCGRYRSSFYRTASATYPGCLQLFVRTDRRREQKCSG